MSRRHLAALQRWDFSFDQGGAVSVADDAGKIRIAPKLNTDSQWMWWAVRSDRLGGKTPRFLVAKANRNYGDPGANEKVAFWGTDRMGDVWTAFDNQSVGASDIEFYNNAPFPNGMIYIASMPLYPFERSQRKWLEWKSQDTRITPIYVGQDARRDNGDGRTAPALPWWGFSLTNASGYTKNNLVITARNHATETPAGFALEGFMTWILGGSAEAEFLLDWFNVYVYPCINPQGVAGGWSYRGPEIPTTQHNDTTAGWDDLDAILADINTRTSGEIEVGIDLHSSKTVGTSMAYVYNVAEAMHVAFSDAYQVFDASFDLTADTTAHLLTKYWSDTFSAALSLNVEQCDASVRTITQHKTSGQYTGRALTAMHAAGRFANGPGVGSRDGNGTTDRIDRASVMNTVAASTVSFWVNLDAVAHITYAFASHNSTNSTFAEIYGFGYADATHISVFFNAGGTTALQIASNTFNPATITGAWHQVTITWDGSTTAANAHIYLDGAELTYATTINGASLTAGTGIWSLCGRYYDDARNLDGKLAQFRYFSRVLSADEIALEAAGIVTTTDGLVSWLKANTSSLTDVVDSVDWTADGTTSVTGVGNGPPIIYG